MQRAELPAGGWLAALLVLALTIATSPSVPAQAKPAADPTSPPKPAGIQQVRKERLRAQDGSREPVDVNPMLSLPDSSSTNMHGWNQRMAAQADQRAALVRRRSAAGQGQARPPRVQERERGAARGGNDTFGSAELIASVGSGRSRRPAVTIVGSLAAAPPTSFTVRSEDNGSIRRASPTGLTSGRARTTRAVIGDGPHGARGDGSGDFDFYALPGLRAGDQLSVDIDTPTSPLDAMVVLYDARGAMVAINDDAGTDPDSQLFITIATSGDYYAMVTGYPVLPNSPFDSGSGTGAGDEGAYRVTFSRNTSDVDYYAVTLRPGDVLFGSVSGAGGRLSVYDHRRREVFGTSENKSGLYPASSPFTSDGNATVDHVARVGGTYYIATEEGLGGYEISLQVRRPSALPRGVPQTIFVDFDGASLDTVIFGAPGVRRLSPFSAFVARWGIPVPQQDALIDGVMQTMRENLKRDFGHRGVRVRLLNSRDHRDVFGRSDVSRVIVGGTRDESGLDTIAISQSVDPGNFAPAETSLVLLDRLSQKKGPAASLNTYLPPSASTSTRVRFVGRAIGNIASHEVGHQLGNWHVDEENGVPNLMDAPGRFPSLFALGRDRVGGTADDIDVDFGPDRFDRDEGITGVENTRTRVRWALRR